jgi:ATP-binding cassette subfamily B protein
MSDEPPGDVLKRYREDIDWPLVRLFLEYGEGNRRWFALGLVTSTMARFLSIVPAIVLGTAIDALFRGEEAYSLPFVPQAWLPQGTWDQFWFSVGVLVVALLGGAVFNFARQTALNLFSHRVKHEVRTASYQRMQRLDMQFFDEMKTGHLMSVLNNDTNRLELFLDNMMSSAIQLGVLIVGIAAVLLWYNWQLAAVTLAIIPVAAVFTYWFMKSVEERYTDVRESVGDLNTRLENNLAGVQVIKAGNTEEYEDERVREQSYTYFRLDWLALRMNFVYRPGMQALTAVAFVATFVVGGIWLISGTAPGPFTGTLTAGNIVVFLLLTQRLVEPLAQMSEVVDRYEDAKASTTRILGLMSVPVEVTEPDDPVELDRVDGRVEFDDVGFAYEDDPVLSGVDFEVEPGQTVGLVGPTGAGKTTVLKLLLRLYDVTDGAVRLDGNDVRELSFDTLRGAMGYVGQENFLFDGSVRENIRYGTFEATDDEVEAAARKAQAHEFIAELPEGYDTRVGERGVKLSGGQRQRVAIARTILGDPEVMLFDEATSAVDTETELLIQRSIDELAAERTTFVVAHRLSTVRDADKVLVIDDGEVVERGTHDDLLERDGLYANLWRVQAGEIDDLPEAFVEEASRRVARQGAHRTTGEEDD